MEEPLPAGGSCLLGALNLSSYVKNREFDYNEFRNDIYNVVKGLNEVLDEGLPLHPLDIQKETVRDYRQIGLGVMGIADMLIKMDIKYDSTEALQFCNKVSFILANTSLKASALLAKEYGVYPKYNKNAILTSSFLTNNTDEDCYSMIKKYGLRNSQILTIAPTGSISTMLEISGGIEPIFSFGYTRKTESLHGEDVYYKVYTKIVKEYMEKHNLSDEEQLPSFFVNAQTINPFKRIEMQSVWQSHIDASISSTLNLPNEATIEDVEQLYTYAWEKGLKGMTIYRDGCARSGILTLDKKEDNKNDDSVSKEKQLKHGDWLPKPKDTVYYERKVYTGCSKMILFIGWCKSENRVVDIFVKHTSKGGCKSNIDGIVILMSGMLRTGGNLESIKKAIEGVGTCNSFINAKNKGMKLSKGSSCPSAILNTILDFEKEMKNETEIQHHGLNKNNTEGSNDSFNHYEIKNDLSESTQINCSGDCSSCKNKYDNHDKVKCPSCGEYTLSKTGGCEICTSCGFSKCD